MQCLTIDGFVDTACKLIVKSIRVELSQSFPSLNRAALIGSFCEDLRFMYFSRLTAQGKHEAPCQCHSAEPMNTTSVY